MRVLPDFDVASEHAVKIAGGGKSLSVLATPQERRTTDAYELSDEARQALNTVLAEDIPRPRRDGA